jgi:hypothetical protein
LQQQKALAHRMEVQQQREAEEGAKREGSYSAQECGVGDGSGQRQHPAKSVLHFSLSYQQKKDGGEAEAEVATSELRDWSPNVPQKQPTANVIETNVADEKRVVDSIPSTSAEGMK